MLQEIELEKSRRTNPNGKTIRTQFDPLLSPKAANESQIGDKQATNATKCSAICPFHFKSGIR
jgi:hypothetical protein